MRRFTVTRSVCWWSMTGAQHRASVATLRAYFEQNSNASETPPALCTPQHAQLSPAAYLEIIGLDLDSADTRLALQVALRIHFLGA